MKEFDRDELVKFDGKDGRPAYVVIKDKVYDITGSKLWKDGTHMKRHYAGEDLSVDIQSAPHDITMLNRFTQIGVFKKDIAEREIPIVLASLIKLFPMLRRHPHPMTVHFPIVFMFSTTVFTTLYLLTGIKSLEITALHCLAAGILFTPITILTGFYTWWLNYMAKLFKNIIVKMCVSSILLITALIVFTWRILVPNILDSIGLWSIIYFLLVLSLSLMVTIIGWFGAELTFPTTEE